MMSMLSRAIDTTIVHIGRGTTHQALSVIPLPSLALSWVSQVVCVAQNSQPLRLELCKNSALRLAWGFDNDAL